MLHCLKNKNILLIIPKFFGYDCLIASRLKNAGAIVTVVYEDMDEVSYYYRFINAYFHSFMPKAMNRYFLKKILPIADKLDFVLLIRGEFLTPYVLDILKTVVPENCKFYMYQWDSTKNNNNSLTIKDYFNKISTFDPVDAEVYSWEYIPLFYIPEYVEPKEEEFDVMFLCSLHSKRIEVLNRLKLICQEKQLKLYKRVYSKRIVYLKRKYINRREGYVNADDADISYKKTNIEDSYKIYNKSRIVVDFAHPGQNGLTMRTIEVLGCRKKLITNNKNVISADFYDPDNIFVYDDVNISIPDSFINKPYHCLDEKIYEKYGLDSWISAIMNLSESEINDV